MGIKYSRKSVKSHTKTENKTVQNDKDERRWQGQQRNIRKTLIH